MIRHDAFALESNLVPRPRVPKPGRVRATARTARTLFLIEDDGRRDARGVADDPDAAMAQAGASTGAPQDAGGRAAAGPLGLRLLAHEIAPPVQRRDAARDLGPSPGPSEDDRQAVRQKVLAAKEAATAAIDRTAAWLRGQWARYIGRTAESPTVPWQPGLREQGLVMRAATPAQASSEGRDAAVARLLAKLSEIDAASAAAKAGLVAPYAQAMDAITPDLVRADLDAIGAWCDNEVATAATIQPSGDDLYHAMLATWVGTHAYDAHDAKQGTNREDWKKACQELYGQDGVPGQAYWAMQLRTEWQRMGLPTDQADTWLRAGAHLTGGEVWFESAVNPEALARALCGAPTNRRFLHVAQGGAFRVSCRFTTQQMAPDVMGAGYLHLGGSTYTLETVGMAGGDRPTVSDRDAPPYDSAPVGAER